MLDETGMRWSQGINKNWWGVTETPPLPPYADSGFWVVTRGLGGSLIVTRGYGPETTTPIPPPIPVPLPADVITTYAADTLSLFISQYSQVFSVQNKNIFIAPIPYVDPVSITDTPIDTFAEDTLSLFISQYSQTRTM